MKHKFDHVIITHEKDFDTLPLCLEGLVNVVGGTDKVYVISNKNPNISGVEFVDEREFDGHFTFEKTKSILDERKKGIYDGCRAGWIYQQFLKLMCWKAMNFTNGRYHVVDSDTIYLRDVNYEESLFSYSRPYHVSEGNIWYQTYNCTFKNLIGKTHEKSYICHNMVFDQKFLSEMISEVETDKGKAFDEAVCHCVCFDQNGPFFSEYEMYGNWMNTNHPSMCKEIKVDWKDISFIPTKENISELATMFDFVSAHAYLREDS